jgi:hypothetical protein
VVKRTKKDQAYAAIKDLSVTAESIVSEMRETNRLSQEKMKMDEEKMKMDKK